ncbi:MAG: 50S ribosomal protein L18 [Gemmatimonadetes bacterium]|nr:50S ribosomal protein L18 [Gemmatimonadota bacterium]MYG85939.1 50S ribosomal protein L18 [Gemmatimonadota bacterium]MYJ89663.1 50S ribosomal protein L18 [Gemmatimonadota bacterium]
MSRKTQQRARMRKVRHRRVRKSIRGDAARPRLNVFRSLKHIYAQVIDDTAGATLLSLSTNTPEIRSQLESGMDRKAQSRLVGQVLGEKMKAQGVSSVTFDRGGYQYHGRVKALAEGVRECGLEF